jgi:hypothetical protein
VSDELVLRAGTPRAASIAEKCAAAVAGGFTAMGRRCGAAARAVLAAARA